MRRHGERLEAAHRGLPVVCHAHQHLGMRTVHISLPEALKSFVDAQTSRRMNSSGDMTRRVVPSRRGVLSLSTT
jgi:hypothetical protein